jgi:hypothetical protein
MQSSQGCSLCDKQVLPPSTTSLITWAFVSAVTLSSKVGLYSPSQSPRGPDLSRKEKQERGSRGCRDMGLEPLFHAWPETHCFSPHTSRISGESPKAMLTWAEGPWGMCHRLELRTMLRPVSTLASGHPGTGRTLYAFIEFFFSCFKCSMCLLWQGKTKKI